LLIGKGGAFMGTPISRREFLHTTSMTMAGAMLSGHVLLGDSSKLKKDAPNILWLLTDEQRWDSIRAYGVHSWLKTPNLDALAAEGALFQEAYCNNPVCVPSRMCMLTGQYSHHTGVYVNSERSHSQTPFSVPYFTDYLHEYGYTLANFGKQHHNRIRLEDGRPMNIPDEALAEMASKVKWAFDQSDIRRYEAFPETPDNSYRAWRDVQAALARGKINPNFQNKEKEMGLLRRYMSERKAVIIGGTNPQAASQTMSAKMTDLALDFMNAMPSDAPSLVRVSHVYPHTPILPPEPYASMYDPKSIPLPEFSEEEFDGWAKQTHYVYDYARIHGMKEDEIRKMRADYYGLCSHVDHEAGRAISAFKAMSQKQGRPWLILYTSDHGSLLGEHGLHEKFTFYDDSVRIPLIAASSDGLFPKKHKVEDFVELIDLAPTMLNAAGIPLPKHLDGRDLAATANKTIKPRTCAISEKKCFGRRAMIRTKAWAFEMQISPDSRDIRPLKPDEMTWAHDTALSEQDVSLFDRKNDPGEKVNLGRNREYTQICEELKAELVRRIFPKDRVEYVWENDILAPIPWNQRKKPS